MKHAGVAARLRIMREEARPKRVPAGNRRRCQHHDACDEAQRHARRVRRAAPAPAAQLRCHDGRQCICRLCSAQARLTSRHPCALPPTPCDGPATNSRFDKIHSLLEAPPRRQKLQCDYTACVRSNRKVSLICRHPFCLRRQSTL